MEEDNPTNLTPRPGPRAEPSTASAAPSSQSIKAAPAASPFLNTDSTPRCGGSASATEIREEASPLEPEAKSPGAGYQVKLSAFEGPLDLLLYLIRREEINIWDIPIAHITEQYLEYIRIMQDLNLNVAGEFLVMAATLIHIKSKLLLPPDPAQADSGITEEEDPRHELVYQLLEHQKFKNAAQMLYAKESVESEVWSHPPGDFLQEGEEMVRVTLFDLIGAYRDIVRRLSQRITLEYRREELTLEQQIDQIRRRLLVQNRLLFSSLFEPGSVRRILVVTFLAILELVRAAEIRLVQDRHFAEIFLERNTETLKSMEMGAGEP